MSRSNYLDRDEDQRSNDSKRYVKSRIRYERRIRRNEKYNEN